MTRVYIAMGSNLGDRMGNLRAAVRYLGERGVDVRERSSVWETAPVPADQPAYLNAVVAAETNLEPHAVLGVLKEIEHALGRRPSRRWGPRPADLDLLLYGDVRMETPELTIPHAQMAERGFVLAPLAEVAPGVLPVLEEGALALLERLEPGGMRRAGDL